jgi:hypothetical protein
MSHPIRTVDERDADGMRQRPDRASLPWTYDRPAIVWVATGEKG